MFRKIIGISIPILLIFKYYYWFKWIFFTVLYPNSVEEEARLKIENYAQDKIERPTEEVK